MADKRANIKTTPQNDYNGLLPLLLLMKPTIMFYTLTVVIVLPAIANEAKSRPPLVTAAAAPITF